MNFVAKTLFVVFVVFACLIGGAYFISQQWDKALTETCEADWKSNPLHELTQDPCPQPDADQ
jgi:hypothetical protein